MDELIKAIEEAIRLGIAVAEMARKSGVSASVIYVINDNPNMKSTTFLKLDKMIKGDWFKKALVEARKNAPAPVEASTPPPAPQPKPQEAIKISCPCASFGKRMENGTYPCSIPGCFWENENRRKMKKMQEMGIDNG